MTSPRPLLGRLAHRPTLGHHNADDRVAEVLDGALATDPAIGVYASYPPTEGADRAVNFRNTNGPVGCRGGLVMGETCRALEY